MLVNVNLSKIKRFGNSFRRRSSKVILLEKSLKKKIVKKYNNLFKTHNAAYFSLFVYLWS